MLCTASLHTQPMTWRKVTKHQVRLKKQKKRSCSNVSKIFAYLGNFFDFYDKNKRQHKDVSWTRFPSSTNN